MLRLVLTLLAATIVPGASLLAPRAPSPESSLTVATTVSDSAREELEAGRYWHAARAMRAEGAANGESADVLLLARAEAGWYNWPAVRSLLDEAGWLDEESAGQGLYLLGRAHEDSEGWARAAEAYSRYVTVAPAGAVKPVAARARMARSRWAARDLEGSLTALDAISARPEVRSWIAVELAEVAADDGDVPNVLALLERVTDPLARRATWRTVADAQMQAGDSAEAARVFAELREDESGARRAVATIELGRLWLARGDTAAAETLLLEGLEDAPRSSRIRAAAPLLDLGGDRESTLSWARIADQAGDGRRALDGYDRVVRMSEQDSVEVPMSMRIERARLMGTVRSRQEAAVEEFRAIRSEVEDERLGARNLEVWTQLRRRQGLDSQVATLRRWLVDEYPGSSQSAEIVFLRGDQAQSRGQFDTALQHFSFVAEHAPSHARAGQGRMKSGQIFIGRGEGAAAVEAYESYLQDFPTGRRWHEASYWAGRMRLELGDTAQAHAHVQRLLTEDPVSYYAVMGSDLIGVPYVVDVEEGEPRVEFDWLTAGLVRIDHLTEAGLEAGAAAEIAALTERGQGQTAAMLALAEELIARGRTIDGINLGWALRGEGLPWDERLLRVTFPFPYQDLVRREAEEWGIDPFIMAALIRQESAFKADIVSHAGAIGLMQVMPPTGAELARTHGPDGFRADNLTTPEVNLHLGSAFFRDMSRRYENDLPLVLSAYNAGPTRANRWRNYPEISDPLRFTERIPFTETRGYVKNVRRNLGLYRVLYGQD